MNENDKTRDKLADERESEKDLKEWDYRIEIAERNRKARGEHNRDCTLVVLVLIALFTAVAVFGR